MGERAREEKSKVEEEKRDLLEKKRNLEDQNSNLIDKSLWLNLRVDELEQEILDNQEESEKEKRQLTKAVKVLSDQAKAFDFEEQRRMVECPVCLMLPREGPTVPCCPQGHFICPQCLDQRKAQGNQDCPTCRGPMGEGKSLLAFTVVKQAKHECSLEGCSTVIPFDEIKQHEEKCNWRLVICPGSDRSCNVMVPFQKVEEHAKHCTGFIATPVEDEGKGVPCKRIMLKMLENQESVKWKTQVVKYENEVFFGRLKREDNAFTLDVVMKANEEDCESYLVEASMVDMKTGKLMFKSIFPPRPLVKENNPSFCLVVPQKAMEKVWKLIETMEDYSFIHHIKINRNIRV